MFVWQILAQRNQAPNEAILDPNCGWFYRATATDFRKQSDCLLGLSNQRHAFENYHHWAVGVRLNKVL